MPKRKPTLPRVAERLVRKWWKDLPAAYDHGSVDKRIKRAWLQEIITEARQSAARECAEIADEGLVNIDGSVTMEHVMDQIFSKKWPGDRIREHFGLEGKSRCQS